VSDSLLRTVDDSQDWIESKLNTSRFLSSGRQRRCPNSCRYIGERRYRSTTFDLCATEDECSVSRPGRFHSRERTPNDHLTGGWVGPRVGLDAVEYVKLPCSCRKSNPGRPARSPSLY
jgi:hypothetical protein